MTILEVITNSPKISLAAIAFCATLFSTLIHKWMTNQEHMKNLRARQKELQEKRKKAQKSGEHKLVTQLQQEEVKIALTLSKSSFRPLFITIIPLLILFSWLRKTYIEILPGWIWWYIGFSIGFSIIIRKALKIS